jgi:hypothetical protein
MSICKFQVLLILSFSYKAAFNMSDIDDNGSRDTLSQSAPYDEQRLPHLESRDRMEKSVNDLNGPELVHALNEYDTTPLLQRSANPESPDPGHTPVLPGRC